MPNIAKVLREEIQRLAKRQARVELRPVRRDNVRLKKIVADLRRQMAALNRQEVGRCGANPVCVERPLTSHTLVQSVRKPAP